MTGHAMFLEDFEPGQSFTSSARTITEADLTLFAMLSGDWNPVHLDEECARTTQRRPALRARQARRGGRAEMLSDVLVRRR